MQAKLLRVLQEREFERVGGAAPIRVDVRVIAATNRDLLKAVREKTFREDLFYRLNVFPIQLPPLRERTEDIPLLVHFLVNKFVHADRQADRRASAGRRWSGSSSYPWPGNIRELENVLERAVILATGDVLDIDPGILSEPGSVPAAPGRPTLDTMERDYVATVLRETDWVIDGPRGAAKILGLHPNTLRNRLKKLGVERDSHHPR